MRIARNLRAIHVRKAHAHCDGSRNTIMSFEIYGFTRAIVLLSTIILGYNNYIARS